MTRKVQREAGMCPFWHELAADFIVMYPDRGYCTGAGHGKPRFPSRFTAQQYCAGNFKLCDGFRRRATQAP